MLVSVIFLAVLSQQSLACSNKSSKLATPQPVMSVARAALAFQVAGLAARPINQDRQSPEAKATSLHQPPPTKQ